LLPTRFDDARNLASESKLTEAEPAHLELAQKAARAAANAAPVAMTDFKLRLLNQFCHL
jgi:hypothetical protein